MHEAAERLRFEQVRLAYDQTTPSQLVAVLNAWSSLRCNRCDRASRGDGWLSGCLLALAASRAPRRSAAPRPDPAELERWRAYVIVGPWRAAIAGLRPRYSVSSREPGEPCVRRGSWWRHGGRQCDHAWLGIPAFVPSRSSPWFRRHSLHYATMPCPRDGWMALVFLVAGDLYRAAFHRGLSDMMLLRIQNAR